MLQDVLQSFIGEPNQVPKAIPDHLHRVARYGRGQFDAICLRRIGWCILAGTRTGNSCSWSDKSPRRDLGKDESKRMKDEPGNCRHFSDMADAWREKYEDPFTRQTLRSNRSRRSIASLSSSRYGCRPAHLAHQVKGLFAWNSLPKETSTKHEHGSYHVPWNSRNLEWELIKFCRETSPAWPTFRNSENVELRTSAGLIAYC